MEIADLRDALVRDLGPMQQRMAARHPEFVTLVVRRLIERTPTDAAKSPLDNDQLRDEFAAAIGLDLAEGPVGAAGAIGPIWWAILLQVLLPALIRAFLRWWGASEQHRQALAELRASLSIELSPTAAGKTESDPVPVTDSESVSIDRQLPTS